MELVAVHLPKDLVGRVDEQAQAADEYRTRASLVRQLVNEGLRRREADGRLRNIPYREGAR